MSHDEPPSSCGIQYFEFLWGKEKHLGYGIYVRGYEAKVDGDFCEGKCRNTRFEATTEFTR